MDNKPRPNKVLIIKTGHSETFDAGASSFVSFGDVLFSTVILHAFKDYHVTWLTDEKCFPLLEGNRYINRLLPYGLDAVLQLQAEWFDTIINLEKVPGICALADSVSAHSRYGFCFDPASGGHRIMPESRAAFEQLETPFIEALFEIINRKWRDEEYVLGYKPRPSARLKTVGLNYLVGTKWPVKAWPQQKFFELRKRLGASGFDVSMQHGEKDLEEYMDWINSCSLIVTGDTLGMHLAIALGKKVVALFGPTSPDRVHFYGRGVKVEAVRDCTPCYEAKCKEARTCMNDISVEQILTDIIKNF